MDLALDERLLGACAIVALVLFVFRWVARTTLQPESPFGESRRVLGIVETLPLPGAGGLYVVRVAERYYAVGRSGAHLATLCEVPAESVARARDAQRAGWRRIRFPKAAG